jgi:hypothetical protein
VAFVRVGGSELLDVVARVSVTLNEPVDLVHVGIQSAVSAWTLAVAPPWTFEVAPPRVGVCVG